jgi:D-tyrosyl-tRNA(Tyr) deacylase
MRACTNEKIKRNKIPMRLVIQRVKEASVTVDGKLVSEIGQGFMVLVGVENGDTLDDVSWLAAKTAALRVFEDENGVMNRSILDVGGSVLAVSQFTLTASTRKGNRPSYLRAAGHDLAIPMYEAYCEKMENLLGRPTKKGIFGADMKVALINDGPVTIIIDSRLKE